MVQADTKEKIVLICSRITEKLMLADYVNIIFMLINVSQTIR
jgi:hypothetical protein